MKTKLLLTSAIFSITTIFYGQDIKIKKGEVSLDNNPVAKVEKVDKKYQFSDLSGNVMFKAIITNVTVQGNETDERWLELTSPDGVTRELELPKKLSFTFSNEKYNTDAVVKSQQNLLTTNGIDKAIVDAFFQTKNTPFSDKWDAIFEKEKALISKEDELIKTDGITIDDKGNIYKEREKIGFISFSSSKGNSPSSLPMSYYTVKDLSGGVIAKTEFNNIQNTYYSAETYDKKEIEILTFLSKQNTSKGVNNDPFAKRLVYRLYANGYPFGDMSGVYREYVNNANAEIAQKNKEIEDKAKSESLNIYDASGYLIDKSGSKHEGTITIEFESIDAKVGKEKNVSNLTSYGNSVSIKTEGEKKAKYHKAKDGVKFCVGERCFLGAKGEEDGAFGHGGSQLDALSGGASQFFEILYENDENYVLAHVKYPEEYYLKLKKNEKAIYLGDKASFFGTKSTDKIKKIFDKYVNCSSLDFSNYNTKSKESMIQIVDDYIKSCK